MTTRLISISIVALAIVVPLSGMRQKQEIQPAPILEQKQMSIEELQLRNSLLGQRLSFNIANGDQSKLTTDSSIVAAGISPNGLYAFTKHKKDKTINISIWDTKTKAKKQEQGDLSIVKESPDSSILICVATNKKKLIIYDMQTGEVLFQTPNELRSAIKEIIPSPNNAYIVIHSEDETIRICNTKEKKFDQIPKIVGSEADLIKITPDGATAIVSFKDGTLRILRIKDKNYTQEIKGTPTNLPTTLAITPDSSHFAVGFVNGKIGIFNIKDGKAVAVGTAQPLKQTVLMLALTPNANLFFARYIDKTFLAYNISSNDKITHIKGTISMDYAVTPPNTLSLLTQLNDTSAKVWLAQQNNIKALELSEANVIRFVMGSPDKQYIFTRSADNIARLLDPMTEKVVYSFNVDPEIESLAIAYESAQIITRSKDGIIKLWGKNLATLTNQQLQALSTLIQLGQKFQPNIHAGLLKNMPKQILSWLEVALLPQEQKIASQSGGELQQEPQGILPKISEQPEEQAIPVQQVQQKEAPPVSQPTRVQSEISEATPSPPEQIIQGAAPAQQTVTLNKGDIVLDAKYKEYRAVKEQRTLTLTTGDHVLTIKNEKGDEKKIVLHKDLMESSEFFKELFSEEMTPEDDISKAFDEALKTATLSNQMFDNAATLLNLWKKIYDIQPDTSLSMSDKTKIRGYLIDYLSEIEIEQWMAITSIVDLLGIQPLYYILQQSLLGQLTKNIDLSLVESLSRVGFLDDPAFRKYLIVKCLPFNIQKSKSRDINVEPKWIRVADTTPDGKSTVVVYENNTIKVWTGDKVNTLKHTSLFDITSIAITPDGKQVLIGYQNGQIKIWNLQGEPTSLGSHTSSVLSIVITLDGSQAISNSIGGVKLWDLGGKKEEALLAFQQDISPTALALTHDGLQAFIGYNNGNIILWNLKTQQSESIFKHQNCIGSIAITPDNLYSIIYDVYGWISVWSLETKKETFLFFIRQQPRNSRAITITSDGLYAIINRKDGSIKTINLETKKKNERLALDESGAQSVSISSDGSQIIVTKNIGGDYNMPKESLIRIYGKDLSKLTSQQLMALIVLIHADQKGLSEKKYQQLITTLPDDIQQDWFGVRPLQVEQQIQHITPQQGPPVQPRQVQFSAEESLVPAESTQQEQSVPVVAQKAPVALSALQQEPPVQVQQSPAALQPTPAPQQTSIGWWGTIKSLISGWYNSVTRWISSWF